MSKNMTYGFNGNKEKVNVFDEEYVYNQFQKVIYKDDIAVIYAKAVMNVGDQMATVNLWYPDGFTCYNSIIIGKEYSMQQDQNYKVYIDSELIKTWNRKLTVSDNGKYDVCSVILRFSEPLTEATTYDIRIVLMKIPEYIEDIDYTLGDVNQDSETTIDDANKIQNYIMGIDSLTAQQYAAADVNNDNYVTSADYLKLKNDIEGTTSSPSYE